MSSHLTERKITCSIPACCLFPNDAVGREDIPLAMLATPSRDTNLIEVLSVLHIVFLVASADIGGSSPGQLFAFTESSARVRFCVCEHACWTEKGTGNNRKGSTENFSTWMTKSVLVCQGMGLALALRAPSLLIK